MKINILLLWCLSTTAFAQDGLSVQLSALAGKRITHTSGTKLPENIHSGFSVDLSKMTFGKHHWEHDHGFPQMGLLLSAQSLGNKTFYGDAFSLVPYLEFNLLRFRKSTFQIKHGTGIAWLTKTYNENLNPDNTLHSTKLNASSILDAGLRLQLNERNDLKIGGILRHISNGGFQKPNAGSNTASLYLNYAYYLRTKPSNYIRHESPDNVKRWRYRFMLSPGFHKKPGNKSLNVVPQVSSMVFYQHNNSFRTGAGLEAGIPFESKPQLSVYLEEEVQFSQLVTRYGLGYYAINRRTEKEQIYSKVGIAWYPKVEKHIPGGFFVGMLLKAHQFNAAHIELNTGYTF